MSEPNSAFPDLTYLFSPRNVLLVGASDRTGSIGKIAFDNLAASKIAGEIFLVGPGAPTFGRDNGYASISELPAVDIDVALIAVPAASVENIIAECARRGVRFAIVISSGFGEMGEEGSGVQRRLAETARQGGMRVYGPNCPGLTNGNKGIGLNISSSYRKDLVAGPIGLVTQGGGLGRTVLQMSKQATGVGLWGSAGNECDLELSDLIAHMVDQPEIGVVAIIAEGFGSGIRFISAAERARSAGKPLVILKVGRSEYGSKAAASHTAAMVGSDEMNSTVFRKHGVIRVADVDELYETAALAHRSAGKRIGDTVVFGFSGGANGFASDILGAEGIRMAEFGPDTIRVLDQLLPDYAVVGNPLDLTTRVFTEDGLHHRCLEAVSGAPETATILIPIPGEYGALTAQLARDIVSVSGRSDRLIVPIWMSAESGEGFDIMARGGILPFRSVGKAVNALRRLARHRRDAEMLRQPMIDPVRLDVGLEDFASMSEASAKVLLARAGMRAPAEELVHSPQQASAVARKLGSRVAMKIVSADILHKTEVGGVLLDVDQASAASSYEMLLQNARRFAPQAQVEGVLVSEMIREGRDFLVAAHHDEIFGPMLTIGLGGTEVELIRENLHFHLPLRQGEIARSLENTRLAAILGGVRGRPALDTGALVAAAEQLAGLALDQRGAIREIEINPLRVLPSGQGAVVLDALIGFHPRLN